MGNGDGRVQRASIKGARVINSFGIAVLRFSFRMYACFATVVFKVLACKLCLEASMVPDHCAHVYESEM